MADSVNPGSRLHVILEVTNLGEGSDEGGDVACLAVQHAQRVGDISSEAPRVERCRPLVLEFRGGDGVATGDIGPR